MYLLFFHVVDDALDDHFLREHKCESINQRGQCGSGIFSYRALGKLQSKVNKQTQTKLKYSTHFVKITLVRDKKSLNGCVTVFWISSMLSAAGLLLLWPEWTQTQIVFYLCTAVGGWQILSYCKCSAESALSKVMLDSCQVVSAGFVPDKTSF